MEEMQSIVKRIEANHDDLDAWQRLDGLVVEPEKKNDCRDQITRIKNKRYGVDTVFRCDQCGASMEVVSGNEGSPDTVVCPVCHRSRGLEGGVKPVSGTVQTGSFIEIFSMSTSTLRGRFALIAIIGSNLWVVFGVLFLGWSMFSVMILYWIENIIVGIFTVLKLTFAEAQSDRGLNKHETIASFCTHFGLYCTVHVILVMVIFLPTLPRTGQWQNLLGELGLPILFLSISHGINFFHNYLRGGIYKFAALTSLENESYIRIAPLILGLIPGAILSLQFGSPIGIILVLIVLKTCMDVLVYLNSMVRWRAQAAGISVR